jgi:hypothetical protein
MELWNEYEGSTIAGTFTLEQLLRPEGRSAFFSTTTGDGRATVLRLIESHYDDDMIVARWTAVSRLRHQHLLGLAKFGQVVMDDTALVYVVMEPADADLGQILRERSLTVPETRQLAVSVVAALEALHQIGLVHEHLQPINILAVGETVKLRSDCVREAPEGVEGEAARQRDVHELALLLLQALTLQRDPDRVLKPAANGSSLPAPFREIIYNGVSGRWTLAQIAKALSESDPAPLPFPTASHPAAAASSAVAEPIPSRVASAPGNLPGTRSSTPTPSTPAAAAPPRSGSPNHAADIPQGTRSGNGAAPGTPAGRGLQPTSEATAPAYLASVDRVRVQAGRTTVMDAPSEVPARQRRGWAALLAAALLAVILVLWYVTHRSQGPASNPPMQTLASMGDSGGRSSAATPQTAPPQTAAPSASSQRPAIAPPPAQPRAAGADWRVIAFTYNLSEQAKVKVDRLSQRNPNLQIEVFAPHGHGPYLVAVGSFMSRDEAMALRNKLRGSGFPRDTYAQNFSSRSR